MQKHERSLKKILKNMVHQGYSTVQQFNAAHKQSMSKLQIIQLFDNYFQFPFPLLIQQFNNPIELPLNQLGKKSNEILFSRSMKYVIKKISKADVQKVQKLKQSYKQHLVHNSQTLLCKILKIFAIRAWNQMQKYNYYMVMEGLRNLSEQNTSYDIKGYLNGRTIQGHSNNFGKDEEFAQSKQLKQFLGNSSFKEREQIIKRIEKDLQFLQNHQIMDYSILITFSKDRMQKNSLNTKNMSINIGIIDYLQEFNSLKKIQSRFKSWFKADFSAIESKQYKQRLIEFLIHHFQIQENKKIDDQKTNDQNSSNQNIRQTLQKQIKG